jgi:hypothetical protein
MFSPRRIIYLHGGAAHRASYMLMINGLAIAQLIVVVPAKMK